MSTVAALLLLALTILSGLKVYYSDTSVEAIPYILAAVGRLLAMLIGSLSLAVGIYIALFLQYALIPTPEQRDLKLRYPDNSIIAVGIFSVGAELILWAIFQWIR